MYKYPYGDSQQLNLDWIINKIKELEDREVPAADLEEIANVFIALTHSSGTQYRRYDYCYYQGKLYRALNDNIGTFNASDWMEVRLGDDIPVLTRLINAIDAAAVVDVKFDTSGTNGKLQQKYHDEYHDVVEVDYTPVQNSKRPLSSNAGYELNGAISDEDTKIQNKTVFLNNKVLNAQHNFDNATPELTLVHFSDIHKDTNALARIMAEVNELPNIDDIICTGDIVQNTYGEIESWWNPKVLTVIGNHDTARYQNGAYDWTYLSMSNRSALYIEPFKSQWNVNHTNGYSYYYKDYTDKKVRLIVLDGMLYMASDTTEATAQTTWLSGLLDSAITNNLHVLIAIHAPSVGAMPLHCDFTKLNGGAFPALTDCVTPASIPSLIETKKANGLNFIGYICGHWHQDGIYFPNYTKQLEYCVTTANVVDRNQWKNNDQYRNETMDAYNVISIDTATNTIKIVRGGGADIDCYMRPRKEISFNYAERRINTLAPLEDSQYYDPNNTLTQDTMVNISEYLNGNYLIVTCARFGYQATEIIPLSIIRDSAPRMYFYNSSGAGKNSVLKFWADGRMKVESTDDPIYVLLAQI